MTTTDRIRAMLVKDYKIDPDRLTADARFEDLGIDSMGLAELMFNIEDEFRVTVPDEQIQLSTLGDVANYIDKLMARNDSAPATPTAMADTAASTGGSIRSQLHEARGGHWHRHRVTAWAHHK